MGLKSNQKSAGYPQTIMPLLSEWTNLVWQIYIVSYRIPSWVRLRIPSLSAPCTAPSRTSSVGQWGGRFQPNCSLIDLCALPKVRSIFSNKAFPSYKSKSILKRDTFIHAFGGEITETNGLQRIEISSGIACCGRKRLNSWC